MVIPIDYNNGKRPQAYYDLISQIKGIDRVPTLIPKNTTKVLSGQEVFDWVETEIKKYKKLPGVTPQTSNLAMSNDRFTPFGSQPKVFVPENASTRNPGRMKISDSTFDSITEERNKLLSEKIAPTNQPAPWTVSV